MTQKDLSYGIIPLKRSDDHPTWQTLLIKHAHAHHWAFPKGHADPGETPLEAATRELLEETGFKIKRLLSTDPKTFVEHYHFKLHGNLIDKTVTYFVAEVKGRMHLQEAEVAEAIWLPLNEALEMITYPATKDLCKKVIEKLDSLTKS
jgi:bis(5'-nucleosidyl)-tetraphosphatase